MSSYIFGMAGHKALQAYPMGADPAGAAIATAVLFHQLAYLNTPFRYIIKYIITAIRCPSGRQKKRR